ncbi:MAG TPA: caspase family protein [Ferruginibacter sp.]|nr:caspase family protein [Ferruginibacter sp.]
MLCLVSLLQIEIFAQPPTTKGNVLLTKESASSVGKTYALITGISTYQANDSYQNLQYADADARAFYNYIISPTGAKVTPANVDTLFNENASFMEFWRKFNRIKEQLQKNDIFYIYFSGHGDAYRADEAYLLAYDAPAGNDRNNYSTGVGLIDIHKLKVRIQEITGKGAQVVLITDACRTNELPGKDEGQAISYQQIFERKAGEIQLISCASNQVSFEGSQWGGGRGLFSWHLINGLKGMADTDPEDGEVTLTELYDYVKKNVNKASYDAKTKKSKQTPQYCCNTADGMLMSKVDKTEKEKLIAMLEKGVSYTPDKNDMAVNKSVHLGSAMKEVGLEELYRLFLKAMNEGKLLEKNGAGDILNQILSKKETTKVLADELKFVLSSKLMTDVTKVINTYLHAGQNNNNYTYDYFMSAANKLKLFEQVADTMYYNPLDVKVNRLFLEGHANLRSFNTEVMRQSLAKVDSAVALKPQAAYLYNLKGLMHIALKQYKEGQAALKKGIALAPNWLYPYHNMGSAYTQLTKFDSALIFYKKALLIDSNYQTTYGGISGMYSTKGNIDSAIYWCRAGLVKDATDPVLWTQLGYAYLNKKDWPNALQSFHKGIYYDKSFVYANEGALRVHMYDYKNDDSVKYYVNKLIAADSANPVVYQSMGNIFTEFNLYDDAIRMFDISLSIDSLNSDTWKAVGATFQAMGKDTFAINAYNKAWVIDSTDYSTYNQLGNLYFGLAQYKEAQYLFGKAIYYNEKNAVLLYNYALASAMAGQNDQAEIYYKKVLEVDAKYASAYYQLAAIYTAMSKPDDAVKNLVMAIKHGDYTKEVIENEPAFELLKEHKGFKAILQKMK